MKPLCNIVLIYILLLQSLNISAGDPVFQYMNEGDFEKLDHYLKDHDIDAIYTDSAITLLVYSILYNESRVTRYLIEKGADVNLFANGKSPLMYATSIGHRKKAAMLVNHRADINALDSVGNTCLFYAARHGDLRMVKYLVRKRVSLNHQNKFRETAYDESVAYAQIEVSKWLRDAYLRNLPDFHDGPYISWKGHRKIKAFYMVHDSVRHLTTKHSLRLRAESNPFLIKGFARDSLEYLVSRRREIQADQFQGVEQIMVIGDIHGGYDSLLVFLLNNRIMDQDLNWTWGQGHLVFLGDIFDRGNKVTEALWLIYRLEAQAVEAGGAVHMLLGNHEIMVLNQDETYVADKYLVMAEKLNLTYAHLFGKHTILGQWLRTRNAILRINDNLFVHAGLSTDILRSGLTHHDINHFVRYFLDHPQKESLEGVSRSLFMGKNGPFWYRGYLEENHEYKHLPETELEQILRAFQASRIFIGHTSVNRITPLYQSRVFAMDVPYYSNGVEMQCILMVNDVLYLVKSSGERKEL